jgi:succinate dehydrogenase / fumarate reductase cytochrome b subunit
VDRDLTYFWIRRVHSLTGIFFGLFLLEHFFINAFAFTGPHAFNQKVALLRSLPMLEAIEICALGLPIAFHCIYGGYILYTGQVNVVTQKYGRNWMYVIQRVTAVLALLFLVYHVWTLRIAHDLEGTHVDFFSLLHALYTKYFIVRVIYVVGVWSAIIHFANGVCTFCMTWGLTITPRSQNMMAVAAVAVAFGYGAFSMASMIGFIATGTAPIAPDAISGEVIAKALGW